MRPDDTTSGDYGYDLVHELDLQKQAPAAPSGAPPVHVATETSDTDEDLAYDLAHDVPK